eukprot:UN05093
MNKILNNSGNKLNLSILLPSFFKSLFDIGLLQLNIYNDIFIEQSINELSLNYYKVNNTNINNAKNYALKNILKQYKIHMLHNNHQHHKL